MHHHQTRRRAHRQVPRSAITILALLIAGMGAAQAQTWTGGSTSSSRWSERFNWQTLLVPASGATTKINFEGNRQLSPVQDLASPFTLNSLAFASNAGAFSLSGNALRFDGAKAQLLQDSTNSVSILNDVQLAADLNVDGPGTVTLGGSLSRVPGTNRDTLVLTKRGAGTLVLAAANGYDATVRIEAGQVLLRDAPALHRANVVVNVDNGLSFGSLAQATLGGLSGTGALALGSTALTIGGASSAGSPPAPLPSALATVSAETVALYSGNITGTTGSVTKAGAAPVRWAGNSRFDRLHVAAGRMQLEGGALTLTNSTEGLMVGDGSAAGSVGQVLEISNGAKVSATGTTVQVDGAAGTLLRITGTGTQLTTGFQTLVGNHAIGTLEVADGGTLAAGEFLAAGFSDGGNGTLRITGGGTVTSGFGLLGVLTGSTGTADVVGSGSRWTTKSLGLGGSTTIQRGGTGTLTVRDGGQVQVLDALTFWTAGSGVTVNGGSLRVGALASDGAVGTIALLADPPGGAALVIDGGINGSFAGTITGGGSLLKSGSGAQTLAGASTGFTGITTIRGGRIVVGHQDALRGSTVRIDVDNGLDVNGLPQVVVGSLAGSGALALGTTQFTLGEDNRDTRYTGVLTGATGSWLVKKGTGTLTLAGSGSQLPSMVVEGGGAVVLDGGSLALTSIESDTSSTVRPALQLLSGGRLEMRNGARLETNGNGRTSVLLDGDDGTELLIDGIGTRLAAGFQTIAGNRGLGRITVRNGGSLDGWGYLVAGFQDGSNGTITLESGGRATAFLAGGGALGGSVGTLVATGAGTQLTVTGALGMGGVSDAQRGGTGHLQVRAGARVDAAQTWFWTAASTIEIDGGSLFTSGVNSTAGGRITLLADPTEGRAMTLGGREGHFSYNGDIDGDGGLIKIGASTQVLSGRNSFTGMVQVQGGTLEMANSSASEYEVNGFGTLRLGERNLGFSVVQAGPGGQVVYTGTTLNGGRLIGPGGHDISAVRRLVGTHIGGGTVLSPASGTTFVGVANEGTIHVLPGRSLAWTGGSNPTGTLVVAGTASVSHFSSGGQIEVAADGTLVSTSGNIVLGGGSRTTVGAVNAPGGTIELRAGGRLQLNGGLLVNNGSILGPVDVNYGGLAKGAGEYGAVFVNDGGRFSPGNSPGTVTTGDATWGSGGSFVVELAAANGIAGQHWDLWAIDGMLTIQSGTTANSRFTISLATLDGSDQAAPLTGFDPHRAWQWQIVDTTGGIVGFDPARVTLDTQGFLSPLAGGTFQLAVQDGDLYVQFAPVPEPETWAQLLGGLGVLGWAMRRRGGCRTSA